MDIRDIAYSCGDTTLTGDADADKRSWAAMRQMFDETFG